MIDAETVKIEYHQIKKENFQIPSAFSCIEIGKFSFRDIGHSARLLSVSENLEKVYLNTFENIRVDFTGIVDNDTFSEITFGKTLGETKQICFGYFDHPAGLELLNLTDKDSVELDFWYLIA